MSEGRAATTTAASRLSHLILTSLCLSGLELARQPPGVSTESALNEKPQANVAEGSPRLMGAMPCVGELGTETPRQAVGERAGAVPLTRQVMCCGCASQRTPLRLPRVCHRLMFPPPLLTGSMMCALPIDNTSPSFCPLLTLTLFSRALMSADVCAPPPSSHLGSESQARTHARTPPTCEVCVGSVLASATEVTTPDHPPSSYSFLLLVPTPCCGSAAHAPPLPKVRVDCDVVRVHCSRRHPTPCHSTASPFSFFRRLPTHARLDTERGFSSSFSVSEPARVCVCVLQPWRATSTSSWRRCTPASC